MKITTNYDLRDFCYLETDDEQKRRQVTGMLIKPNGIMYELCCGTETTYHYEFEMTKERSYAI